MKLREYDGLYAALERLERTLWNDKMRLMLGLDAKIQLVSPTPFSGLRKAKKVTDLRKSDEASGQF